MKRQGQLSGFEREAIPELDDAIAEYVERKSKRVQAQSDEKQARQLLFATMRELVATNQLETNGDGNAVYVYVDGEAQHRATLTRTEQVKVLRESLGDDDYDTDVRDDDEGYAP